MICLHTLHKAFFFLFHYLLFPYKHIFCFFLVSLSGLWGLAKAQSWLLYKRVSSGRSAAREGGADAEPQTTGKNGLIRPVVHLRPPSNAAALLHCSRFFITVAHPHPSTFTSLQCSLTWSPMFVLPNNCSETVVDCSLVHHARVLWCISRVMLFLS